MYRKDDEMKKCLNVLTILFFMSNIPLLFAQDNLSSREEERQKIISELTYHLNTKSTCTQTLIWDDSGSTANLDGYFFIPSVGQSEFIIGGYASQEESLAGGCITTVSESNNNPQGTPDLLLEPSDLEMIWKDKGSGAKKDGSMWKAISLDSDYVCLGNVPQLGYNKPNISNYRCVLSRLTEKILVNTIVWSDKGSGADVDVTMFRLPNTGSFTTVASHTNRTETYDLKKGPSSVTDLKNVDARLSERIKEIESDQIVIELRQ